MFQVKSDNDFFMRKNLFDNMKVAFALLGALLLSVLIAEKSGQIIIFGYIYKVSLVVFFLISVYMNRTSFVNVRKIYLRYFLIILLCSSITLLFGYIALIITINFDLAIGGHL
jgi:hypothetical protein